MAVYHPGRTLIFFPGVAKGVAMAAMAGMVGMAAQEAQTARHGRVHATGRVLTAIVAIAVRVLNDQSAS